MLDSDVQQLNLDFGWSLYNDNLGYYYLSHNVWLLIKSLTVLALCRFESTFFEAGITLLTLFERIVSGFN